MDATILVTSCLAFVLYLNTLDADFAYDDSRAIQKNQDLLPETPLINIFYDDFWGTPLVHSGSHKSYRPLCVLSFRLNYYLGELNPWGYHLGNVLLHCIVTAVFTKLSRILLKETFPALVSGLIFASHPVHTEAVAGVVGRADVGACLFFILAILCYMKYVDLRDSSHDPGGQRLRSARFVYFGGTALMTSASMLTKEQGVTVIGVCAAYDLFVHNKMKIQQILTSFTQPKGLRSMEGVLLLGLLGVCLVAFRIYFMENKPPEFAPSDNPASDSNSIVTRTLTYLLLPTLNIWLMLCPRVLSFDWSMSAIPLVESIWDYRNMFTILFYSTLVYLAYIILHYIHYIAVDTVPYMNGNGHSHHVIQTNSKHSTSKTRISPQRQTSVTRDYTTLPSPYLSSHSINILVFSISLLVFPFIPATNLFFYVGFVIAERVLYIPSMGFCLLMGHGSYVLYKKWEGDSNKQKLEVAMLAVLILLNGGKTMSRNLDWSTEERLYTSGVATNPPKAWGNLANIYNNHGRVTDAETAYRNALKYRPNMSDVHYNLGILLQNQKRYKEAVESYNTAISYRPNLSMAHLNLGILLAQLGETEQAEKVYKHCSTLDTGKLKDPRLHDNTKVSCLYNLGRLYSDEKRYDYECVPCGNISFPKYYSAARHVQERHSHFSWQCLTCKKLFTRRTIKHGCSENRFEFMAPDGERGDLAFNLFRRWKLEKQDRLIKQVKDNRHQDNGGQEKDYHVKIRFDNHGREVGSDKRLERKRNVPFVKEESKRRRPASPEKVRPRLDDRIQEMISLPTPLSPINSPVRQVHLKDLEEPLEIVLEEPPRSPVDNSSSSSSSSSDSSDTEDELHEIKKDVEKENIEKIENITELKRDVGHNFKIESETVKEVTVKEVQLSEEKEIETTTEEEEVKECVPLKSKEVQELEEIGQTRILLNIGGQKFDTSRVTLKKDPMSLFAEAVEAQPKSDYIFFDRDPAHFRFILNFLRNNCTCDLRSLPQDIRYLYEIYYEAKYYKLANLMGATINKINQLSVFGADLDLPFNAHKIGL